MRSTYRLNKNGGSRQPCHSFLNLEPINCSIQSSNCCFLTHIQESGVRRQVRWSSIPISLRAFHFVIRTVKGFSIVDETELDAFLEFPSFLYDPENVAICFLVPLPFSKSGLGIWKLLVHIMLNLASKILSITLLAWEMSTIVWWLAHSLVPFLGIKDKNWPFLVLWPTARSFRFADILNATTWWHHALGFWIVLLEF